MADYKTELVVGADTSDAERKLDALERRREQLDGGGDAGAAPAAPPPAPAPPRPPGSPPSPSRPDRDGDVFGRAAARQIGRAIAGYALHQGAAIAFGAARTPGASNVNVDRAEATVGGALQYGTMGAMLGGPIGAVIGGLAGAAAGLVRHEQELSRTIAENRIARGATVYRAGVAATARASDAAFGELLQGRTLGERASMLEARREELRAGAGGWSIASLEKELRRREDRGETSGREYESIAENLAMQRQREAALTDQIIATRMENSAAMDVRASDFSDAYSKRGLTVGGDAATAAMNEQLAIGREQVQLLRRIAEMGGGGSDSYSARQVERTTATFGR